MKHIAQAIILWLVLAYYSAQGQGISITNGTAQVSWPLTGYHYLLQSTTNLADNSAWNNLGSASPVTAAFAGNTTPVLTNFTGTNLFLTQPAANAQQFFRLNGATIIPVFSFAVFYDQLLELSDSPTMLFNGLVHANGPIYTGPGTSASQIFNAPVTTTNTITSPANAGFSSSSWSSQVYFNGSPPLVTNVPAFVSPVGTNNVHALIDMPPPLEPVMSQLGQARLYNQAQIILMVTNSPLGGSPRVMVRFQNAYNGLPPGADVSKVIYDMTNVTEVFLRTNVTGLNKIPLPFLSLTNIFVDQRQSPHGQFVTQIDVNQLNAWMSTNPSVLSKFSSVYFPTILYVADLRNLNTSTQAVIRLVNGAKLPFNSGLGFTVATQNPLYVKGDYNITVSSNTYALTLGSTTNNATVPAALIADALTILSPAWNDSLSSASYATRNAASMTVNAAILAGNVPSTGTTATTFSGGLHNLPRFLENWTGNTLVLNTSLVCLYSSQMATNQFRFPGAYYTAPTRLWGFDTTLLSPFRQPPGTPVYGLP